MYFFSTEKMSVGYDKKPILENIEIGVERGEILTLIGPNGAGKSTILKSIAKQLDLVAGTAYLDGISLSDIPRNELPRRQAQVFTGRLNTELMTCRDVVAMGRYPYTGKFGILSAEDYRTVDEAMELVRITALAHTDFNKISDGQRQRVMMARALCQKPELILLDEPVTYLDIKHKLEFLSLLQEMAREKNITVIMSLHELDLARKISDKILCIGENGAERYGAPEEIFKDGYITDLFHIDTGSYGERSDSLELEPPKGEPRTFVLAGMGTGMDTFRKLQRQGVPFVTGIIYENDLDYPTAKALAAHIICEAPYSRIGDEKLEEAKCWLKRCNNIICCRDRFGDWESGNQELYNIINDIQKI